MKNKNQKSINKQTERKLKAQVKKMEERNFTEHPFCLKCDKPMLPATECIDDCTEKWDEHTWKFNCDCIKDKNIRLSIG